MMRMPLFGIFAMLAASLSPAAEMPGEKTHVNSLKMTLVRIEPGEFLMGSATGGDFDERPAHRVRIARPYYLANCEVTNQQYEQFDAEHRKLRGKQGFSQADDEAVVFVSWNEAAAFCQWLSEKEGLPYRLPTEAEWEFACRAGTSTPYSTGDSLPKPFQKNVGEYEIPNSVSLAVGRTPANAWGLYDLHGNVEEWCSDWYGPYSPSEQTDPVGQGAGDFRVTRGGSHSTRLEYLRSANRLGTLPEDKSWAIGFRVALGPGATTRPLPPLSTPARVANAKKPRPIDLSQPFFRGPQSYLKIPPQSEGPLFSRHNHDPAIVNCPNGDLLAIWYTCRSEPGRELALASSRLVLGADEWEPAQPFWDAPDRNDHAPALFTDGKIIYHFVGLAVGATWGNLAVVLRTSEDSGFTWSKARLIAPEHGFRHQPVESVICTRNRTLLLPCDAVPGGRGGTAVLLSRDGGQTWADPGEGKPSPEFRAGKQGAWIAGIHAGVVELKDGRWLAFGRGDNIEGRMPRSVSADEGKTWTYSASPFQPIGSGQRLALLRLAEGPILLVSFRSPTQDWDASGLFAALSFDEGKTWPVEKLITDRRAPQTVEGGGNTGRFTLSARQAEPGGYLSICQAADGVVHLISSKQHYAFNLAWLKTKE